jgi:nucleoside-diphosphate kinase
MTTLEETLVLIKPDGVARNLTGEILSRLEAKGYQLVDVRMVEPNRELLAAHYAEHEGKPFYEPLVAFMESGPVVAIRLGWPPGHRRCSLALWSNRPHGGDPWNY